MEGVHIYRKKIEKEKKGEKRKRSHEEVHFMAWMTCKKSSYLRKGLERTLCL